MFTRRTMMAAAPLAAGLAGSASAQTPAPAMAASGRASGFHRYKVGDIEVTAINDGFAVRPLEGFVRNADIADVRKAVTDAFMPEDGLRITFTTHVVRAGGKTIVIDTGNGDTGAPTTGTWMANFRAAGFDPAAVDTVIISHFHGDHINGLRLKDGTAVFPKAEVMVPAPEWAFWMDDAKMAAAPEGMKGAFGGVRRVFGPMAKDVKQYEMGKEIAPGITTVAAFGHTPGHTAYAIASGGKSLMLVSDITNHPALFVKNPTWAAIFDMDGDMARTTRIKMLDMIAAEKSQVAFYHAPFPATGHIAKEGSGYRFVPLQFTPGV